eukprot:7151405-Pyramimonas_sp.AAC.1
MVQDEDLALGSAGESLGSTTFPQGPFLSYFESGGLEGRRMLMLVGIPVQEVHVEVRASTIEDGGGDAAADDDDDGSGDADNA